MWQCRTPLKQSAQLESPIFRLEQGGQLRDAVFALYASGMATSRDRKPMLAANQCWPQNNWLYSGRVLTWSNWKRNLTTKAENLSERYGEGRKPFKGFKALRWKFRTKVVWGGYLWSHRTGLFSWGGFFNCVCLRYQQTSCCLHLVQDFTFDLFIK